MPFGFPAFPSSSGKPRLPKAPNHPYWKQQAKSARPPLQQYRDSPRNSISKEHEKLVEYKDDVKGSEEKGEKKERKKTDWALISESRALSR